MNDAQAPSISKRKTPASTGQRERARLKLTLVATTGRSFAPFLRKHLPAAHALLDTHLIELSVALVGDAKMSQLHEQFMSMAGPTDVLTFPLEFDDAGRETAGEIVVCVPEARRQAKAHGVAVEHELLLYALHGMLHLSGFDDRTDPAFRRMHRKEDQILTAMGLGPVFRPGATAARRPAQMETSRASVGAARGAGKHRMKRGSRGFGVG